MIIILLHILASDVGPRKKIKMLFLFHFEKNLGWKFRELAKNKIFIFFLFGHLEGRLIRAPIKKFSPNSAPPPSTHATSAQFCGANLPFPT
jgi:hypothetical protein